MKTKVVLFLILTFFVTSLHANNVQLAGTVNIISAGGGTVTMEVDLSWDNSWRDDYNWDAVWLFFKYKQGVDGAWQHASINATTATVTGGDYTTMSGTTASTVPGLFVYPSKDRGGNTGMLKAQVQWASSYTKAQFDNNDVFVVCHGIEMVYIPYGAYTIGDGSSANSFCDASGKPIIIDSEASIPLSTSSTSPVSPSVPFPKGYQGFYIMKYETSQEQYVEFLNTLTLAQQTALIPGVDALKVGNFVFGTNKTAPNYRNGVILSAKQTGKPLMFDNNLNNNKQYSEDGDGGTLAMNYMSISDAAGYASWAGLRPITEMEYEKACRRPFPQEPDAGEYAWNSATGAVNAGGLTLVGSGREVAALGNVNASNTIQGPIRCGIFARPTTATQTAAGATYWGVMEMSGNVGELCANITNTTISKTGNGTGTYNATLFGSTPSTYGTRGGGFSDTHTTLATSDRSAVSRFTDVLQRAADVGFRCVLTYNTANAVKAGTIAVSDGSTTICPDVPVSIISTAPASAEGMNITGYVWTVNGTVVPNVATAEFTITSGFPTGTTHTFVRKALCPLGEAATQSVTVMVKTPKLVAGSITATNRCDVGEVVIRHQSPATVDCDLPIAYSWLVNGVVVPGDADSLTYNFTTAGSYPVIRRTAAGALTADASVTVTVTNPAIQAGSIACGVAPVNTAVTISNSTSGGVSCGGFTYSWTVDGAAVSGTGSSLTHTFLTVGNHTIVRRSTADNGTFSDATVTVSVHDCGRFTDARDGKSYTAALMPDGKCWMTQDLKFGTCVNGTTYDNNRLKSAVNLIAPGYYGVCIMSPYSGAPLYNWQAAMNNANAYYRNSYTPSGRIQGICPEGWYLPSKGEFLALYNSFGANHRAFAGCNPGFCPVLGGYCMRSTVDLGGTFGYYWSSTYENAENAYYLGIAGYTDLQYSQYKGTGLSVRCIKN